MTSTHSAVAKLCIDLDRKVNEYDGLLLDRANAEVDFKAGRARRRVRAQTDGEAKSFAAAETIADADPVIETLWRASLVADAMAAACKEAIGALKERIGYGRSVIADERVADTLHTQRSDVA